MEKKKKGTQPRLIEKMDKTPTDRIVELKNILVGSRMSKQIYDRTKINCFGLLFKYFGVGN